MSETQAAIDKAEQIGAQHGADAASWYFDGNNDYDDYVAVLKGIEEGDPMIMDTLPSSPLSGEWAESYSLADLSGDTDTPQDSDSFDDVCTAYEDAYYQSSQDQIVRVAHLHSDPSDAVIALDTDSAYQVAGNPGIAWRIIGPAGGDEVRLYMIGDDQTFTFDVSELEPIDDDAYCPGCGQIGCGAYH